ncbi:hypothetical protein [Streptomyces sp. NBC_00483]|uniref:hypothetical protein n=1 Tax=Streptomyces sp. NBC_00483 TaxID=2975756 RepID=UPI002E171999
MPQKPMYVIIAVLAALVVALTTSLVAAFAGERPTAVFKSGGATFGAALTLALGVLAALGVVGP